MIVCSLKHLYIVIIIRRSARVVRVRGQPLTCLGILGISCRPLIRYLNTIRGKTIIFIVKCCVHGTGTTSGRRKEKINLECKSVRAWKRQKLSAPRHHSLWGNVRDLFDIINYFKRPELGKMILCFWQFPRTGLLNEHLRDRKCVV